MNKLAGGIVFSSVLIAALLGRHAFAQSTNVTEAEAKMFAASAGYERFMGRWSQLLAPPFISFAGVKNGQRVLDRAIQFHGGVGVSHDRPLAEMYAYQRVVRIGEGADEVHRETVAKLELARQRERRVPRAAG